MRLRSSALVGRRRASLLVSAAVQCAEVPAAEHAPVFWRERLGAGIVALTREWTP
jgi:hypothetical protein